MGLTESQQKQSPDRKPAMGFQNWIRVFQFVCGGPIPRVITEDIRFRDCSVFTEADEASH